MGAARVPRGKWVEEGLRVLADGGPDAVRVEVLAKRLGVTKGGFYGYFADRDALLEAMLDAWERESTDEVIEQVEREGGDAKAKIHRAGMLTFSGDRLLPIDMAVRVWARRDEAVAARLRRVDNRRMDLLREMIGTFCEDPDEVEARGFIAFCVAIAHHSITADHEGRARVDVLVRAADLLLERDGR
ncbi:TetR/AcrR family transcriptional regulator [Actinomadura sp. 21ATH]|uniref:TetR/AcrR family transcriptional regulator n=1 Tax=Actinomadura sp. 21ATH TaxID=1735444 RepID=UPI0035C1FD08